MNKKRASKIRLEEIIKNEDRFNPRRLYLERLPVNKWQENRVVRFQKERTILGKK